MLFASNEHGLFSHTTRFAFLSQAQLCQGVDPALLSSVSMVYAKVVLAPVWRKCSGTADGAEHFGIIELLSICLWQHHLCK